MKFEIQIEDDVFAWAERYTLDPVAHAASMFDHWAQLAQQANPSKTLEEVPTVKEANDALEKQQAEEAETARLTQELADADAADKAAVQARQEAEAQAVLDKAAAEQRDLEIKAAAKAMLEAALPDLRAMVAAEMAGEKASTYVSAAQPKSL